MKVTDPSQIKSSSNSTFSWLSIFVVWLHLVQLAFHKEILMSPLSDTKTIQIVTIVTYILKNDTSLTIPGDRQKFRHDLAEHSAFALNQLVDYAFAVSNLVWMTQMKVVQNSNLAQAD